MTGMSSNLCDWAWLSSFWTQKVANFILWVKEEASEYVYGLLTLFSFSYQVFISECKHYLTILLKTSVCC